MKIFPVNIYKTTSMLNKTSNGINIIKQQSNSQKFLHKKFVLPVVAGAIVSLFASTCSNTRGGNFIYNEQIGQIEKFDDSHKLDVNDFEYSATNKYNLRNCYDKDYLRSQNIDEWITCNSDKLIGSCLFDKNNKLMSNIIGVFTNQSDCSYVPTHAA